MHTHSEGLLAPKENLSKKVALHTLGCRLNFSETGSIAQGFAKRGYEVVPFGETADVVFINTCTVTDQADSTCRNLIRKAHKSSPEGKVVVAGCYAQMEAPKIQQIQGVDLVLGTTEKYKVFDYLEEEADQIVKTDKTIDFYGAATSMQEGHTRAFLKIQDGCNYVCSFCIIPQARGRSRAASIASVIKEAKGLIDQGFKEIILTGVNIGEYESASGERLADLLSELSSLDGLKRLRLSSVEPNTLSDEVLSVLKESNVFLDHFHIPLQSGCDEILTSMRRKYNVDHYTRLIEKVVRLFPEAGIGADVIAGYPGETDEQFEMTYKLLEDLPITHFHVFPYSRRKNTTANRMENHIQHALKKQRVARLIKLGEQKLSAFTEDQVGRFSDVLFERRNKAGLYMGHTTNFVKVYVDTPQELRNQIHQVKLTDYKDGKLYAKLS
jgi:threonylcarbamoyladenosine tRNA methylthiotransferase MtaB